MGYLKSIGTGIIYIGLFLTLITFVPGLPPYTVEFEEYDIVSPAALKGKLALNNKLNGAEKLFERQILSPESYASYNGELYTGLQGDGVVKITEQKLIPVVNFGNKSCQYIWQEGVCGKPLGLDFDKNGNLYVADPYFGIFKVDVKTGKYVNIIDISKPIDGKEPKICNSVDVASNGDIYWTDSSTDFVLHDGLYTLFANPSGRLIRYNAATKKNEVLVKNLGFANGIKLSKNEDFVIVAETLTSRITKYNLKGPKIGKTEIFIEGLPGLPDNLHSDGQNGFLLSLVTYVDEEHPQLPHSLMPHPYLRKLLIRLFTLIETPFKCLQQYYPNYYTDRIVYYIGSFKSFSWLSPDIATVLRIDEKGNIVDAAYANDGRIHSISSAFVHKNYLWLGSPFEDYIARVPLEQVFPDLVSKPTPKPTAAPTTISTPSPTTTTTKRL